MLAVAQSSEHRARSTASRTRRAPPRDGTRRGRRLWPSGSRAGRFPLDEALPIARQIAEALEAAHEQGIIHRDLKPANIKVRPDGTVKVLDFGLAKALDPASRSPRIGSGQFANSPTITSPAMTMRGVILGTAAYMSPEQARGKAVDKRTDIWAFGCVLFEMLTGRRAFDGEDVADTLSRVIQRDPAWELLPAAIPPRIVDVLQLCLEKHPRARRSDIADVRIDLDLALKAPPAPVGVETRRRGPTAWIVATVATVLAGTLTIPAWRYWSVKPAASVPAAQFLVTAPNGDDLQRMTSVSPDGTIVAFVGGSAGNGTTWLRRLGSTEAVTLESARGLTRFDTFWSPDSRQFAFRDGSKLKAADIATGATRVIGEVADARRIGGTWNRDGIILLGGVNGLVRIPAAGGTPTIVAMNDGAKPDVLRADPQFFPDGHHFLYTVQQNALTWSIHVGDLASGQSSRLLDADSPAQAASGFILFARSGTLFAQPFDPRSLQLSGAATPIGPVPAGCRVVFGIADRRSGAPIAGRESATERSGVGRSQGHRAWQTDETAHRRLC